VATSSPSNREGREYRYKSFLLVRRAGCVEIQDRRGWVLVTVKTWRAARSWVNYVVKQ
jgi:hypothetical protein